MSLYSSEDVENGYSHMWIVSNVCFGFGYQPLKAFKDNNFDKNPYLGTSSKISWNFQILVWIMISLHKKDKAFVFFATFGLSEPVDVTTINFGF